MNNVEVINNPRSFISDDASNQCNNRIITAGRLEPEKGYDRLIEIFNDLDIKSNNWKLDIYGDGREKQSLINKIKSYGLDDIISILPFTDRIKEEFLKSDLYVLPSRTEAFGMVLLEAMECGLPCISFDLPGPSEIIKSGEDGFIIEFDNMKEFVDKLKILITDDELRKLYSEKAKENTNRFDISKIADRWKQLYSQIL